jgi:hypothetical protein
MGKALGHVGTVADQLSPHLSGHGPGAQGIDPRAHGACLIAQFADDVTPHRFAEGLAHSQIIEGWLCALEGEVGDDQARVSRVDEIGVLLGSGCRQVAVHIGVREDITPVDPLAQQRCYHRLWGGDEVDLHLVEIGEIFFEVVWVTLVFP